MTCLLIFPILRMPMKVLFAVKCIWEIWGVRKVAVLIFILYYCTIGILEELDVTLKESI